MSESNLPEYIDSLAVISVHEHLRPFPPEEPVTLDSLLNSGYVSWSGVRINSPEDRARFLDLLGGNSYFVWHEKALDDLFHFGGEITLDNWESISAQLSEALADEAYHELVFREKCRYSKAILDAFWNPGDDNGRPDLYAPTLRMNSFVYGRTIEGRDHNGNNAQILFGRCEDFDEYLALMEEFVAGGKANGAVSLKSALAYDRHLHFQATDKADAARAFNNSNAAPEEEIAFGDYIYDQVCLLAAKYDLPFQNHVGLGKLPGSSPMNLIPMIERHPDVKFVLFHMGYPWIEEVCALSHQYPNVYPDLTWAPSICTSAAVRALHSLIETARDSSRVCWGGDCWMITESYGASLAMRWVLKKVLCEKVEEGYLTEPRARLWAEHILCRNASELYGISLPLNR
jgi:hypothetical protein